MTNARFAAFVAERAEWRRGALDPGLHNGRYLEHWTGNGPAADLEDHPAVFVTWHAVGEVVDPVAGGPVADGDLLAVTGRRAVRGASFGGSVVNLRTRWRDSHEVTNAREFIGFRCAYPTIPTRTAVPSPTSGPPAANGLPQVTSLWTDVHCATSSTYGHCGNP